MARPSRLRRRILFYGNGGVAENAVPYPVAGTGAGLKTKQRRRPYYRHVHDAVELGRHETAVGPGDRWCRPVVFRGQVGESAREGFPFWMGDVLYSVKWQDFKMSMYVQRTLLKPALKLASPHCDRCALHPFVDGGSFWQDPEKFWSKHSQRTAYSGLGTHRLRSDTTTLDRIPLRWHRST